MPSPSASIPSQSVQDFLGDTLGSGWRSQVPRRWGSASFDWAALGDFGE